MAPVGKSGPVTIFNNSLTSSSGFSMRAIRALTISVRFCGGIFVAMPTAIPSDPFTSKAGNVVGRTVGSFIDSSKFSCQSTVFFSRSIIVSLPSLVMRASVYLIAAARSPSTEPKFPCPSTSSYLMAKSCAILTRASYTEESPCG